MNYHSYLDKEKSHVITIIIVVIGIKQDRAILPVVTSVDEQSNVNPRLLLEFWYVFPISKTCVDSEKQYKSIDGNWQIKEKS